MPIPNFISQDQRPGSALARVHLLLRNLMLETGMSHGDRRPSVNWPNDSGSRA